MTRSIGEDFCSAGTEHLLLRRPRTSDLQAVHLIHADPATNVYNPAGPDLDMAASARRLQEWIGHWDRHSFGYWAVESLDSMKPEGAAGVIGFAGLRLTRWLDQEVLNLYYRLAPDVWGRGFAVEAARHALLLGARHFPDIPVLARTKPENIPSQRTALAAGLLRRKDLDRDDGSGQSVIFSTHTPERTDRTAQ